MCLKEPSLRIPTPFFLTPEVLSWLSKRRFSYGAKYEAWCLRVGLAIVVIAKFCLPAYGQSPQVTIISPSRFADVDGEGADTTSGQEARAQQLFPAGEFGDLATGTFAIHEIAFRPSAGPGEVAPAAATYADITIRLGLTDADLDDMDVEFDRNFRFEPVAVYEGEITVTTEDKLSPNGTTKEFDQVIPFQRPFLYNPDDGNLLIEYRVNEGLDVATMADFFGPPPVSFILFVGDANAKEADHVNGNGGYVTQFTLELVGPGDFDGNDILDVRDIDLLTDEVAEPTGQSFFDVNGDRIVDASDRVVWVEDIKGTFFGDANLDGTVDAQDLNLVALNWQRSDATSWAQGDFSGEGKVDATDLNRLGIHWQREVNVAASVPEPSAFALSILLVAAITVWSRHARK